jgi:pimeloyl-ACP methyl ester carboxylesterase
MMRIASLILALTALLPWPAVCQTLREIRYVSAVDNSEQPAMFYDPQTSGPAPLLVALHTWGADYRQDLHAACAAWCMKNGWAYIHPDFRGPNNRPEATGSPLVIGDIISAVEYAGKATKIDATAIYLVGTSGGGYTALLMAGRHPEIWAGVSVWVPIADLRTWYGECKKANREYVNDMARSCGGAPGDNPAADEQYRLRSPLTYLANAKGLNLHINAGIADGHTGSVPVSHSLHAFNAVAAPQDRLSESDIRFFVEQAAVPPHLRTGIIDPAYGNNPPLFRRSSGNATITIFQGGHEFLPDAALTWLEGLEKNRIKGKRNF